MNLYVKNNRFWFELENLTRLFFPNEKINVYKEFSEVKLPYVPRLQQNLSAVGTSHRCKTCKTASENQRGKRYRQRGVAVYKRLFCKRTKG